MKDFKKLWDQAKVQAKTSNGDVFEIYAQLSGAQIVSKYKDEIAEKLKKAGYKFHLDDKFLYLTTLSGKSKIIPIYNPEYRHIFSEAEIIVENKNSFWREFVYENFKNDENLPAVKKQFDHCERENKIKQELKDYFGIIDIFENENIKKIEKEIIAKNISKLNPRGDSVLLATSISLHLKFGMAKILTRQYISQTSLYLVMKYKFMSVSIFLYMILLGLKMA
ncbi:hypothetical protein QM027_09490 [Campylobacter concisus]